MTAMHSGREPHRTDWSLIALVIGAGVAAGMQVGKLPPLLPALRDEFSLGLVLAGFVASSFNIVGAACGLLGGAASDRLGGPRSLAFGLLLLASGSAAGAFAPSGMLLAAGRFVEGIGFVLVVVSASALVATLAAPAERKLALGWWSAYMPLGAGLGLLIAPPVAAFAGWRGVWLACAILAAGIAVMVLHQRARLPRMPARTRLTLAPLRQPGPWLLAGCFATYTAQWFSLVTWLPTFFADHAMLTGGGTAVVMLLLMAVNIGGNLASATLMHRGIPRWLLIAAASGAMGICATAAFAGDGSALFRAGMALLASGIGGCLPAAVLASVPSHTSRPGELATVNGFVVQVLNIGSFLGPPGLAWAVGTLGGWPSGRWLLLAAGLLGALLAIQLGRVERQIKAAAA